MPFFMRNVRHVRKLRHKAGGASDDSTAQRDVTSKMKSDEDHDLDDESICSTDEEMREHEQRNRYVPDSTSDEDETVPGKRLRLAKEFLIQIEEKERNKVGFEENAVAKSLEEDYLQKKLKLKRAVASYYSGHDKITFLRCRDHKESVTCVCLTNDGQFLFSGSKDGSLVKWSVPNKLRLISLKGKSSNRDGLKRILCIAVSADCTYLVVGSERIIRVYSAVDLKHLTDLQGHKDTVSGLVFRMNTHTLYSASADRSVRVWNMDDMAYVESFFGHQSGITAIHALSQERAITSGGFDGSIRIWKISGESQLIFNGHSGSIDSVQLINEENFLSCGDDGQLCIWGCLKKKPLCYVREAHGRDYDNNSSMWITSIATLVNTDLVASGSRNGVIKLWGCGESFKSLDILFEIKVDGFINALTFSSDGKYLLAGIGQEHRLGRWWRVPQAKNGIAIIPLIQTVLHG